MVGSCLGQWLGHGEFMVRSWLGPWLGHGSVIVRYGLVMVGSWLEYGWD